MGFRGQAVIGVVIALAYLVLGTTAASAANDIQITQGQPFTHQRTGTVFAGEIAGLKLTHMADFGSGEWDIAATYGGIGPSSDEVTVYLFRAGLPDVSVWSGRVIAAMTGREPFQPPDVTALAPRYFSPADGAAASGMRLVYAPAKGPFSSTGAVLLQQGKWLFEIRASSEKRSVAELDRLIDSFIAAFPHPQASPMPLAVYRPEPCRSRPTPGSAEELNPDTGAISAAMLPSLTNTVKVEGNSPPPAIHVPRWCADPASTGDVAIFRPDDSDLAYVIPLSDSGIVLSVGYWDGLLGQLGQKNPKLAVPVILRTSDADTLLGLFKTPPSPQQALDVLQRGAVLAASDRESNLQINGDDGKPTSAGAANTQ